MSQCPPWGRHGLWPGRWWCVSRADAAPEPPEASFPVHGASRTVVCWTRPPSVPVGRSEGHQVRDSRGTSRGLLVLGGCQESGGAEGGLEGQERHPPLAVGCGPGRLEDGEDKDRRPGTLCLVSPPGTAGAFGKPGACEDPSSNPGSRDQVGKISDTSLRMTGMGRKGTGPLSGGE